MDYKRREEIFSKEVLTIQDVMELYDKAYSTACDLIRKWKMRCRFKNGELRLDIEGQIHILDYFEVMGIDPETPGARYGYAKKVGAEEPRKTSVCMGRFF